MCLHSRVPNEEFEVHCVHVQCVEPLPFDFRNSCLGIAGLSGDIFHVLVHVLVYTCTLYMYMYV